MPAIRSKLATVDKRPYFEKALTYGVHHAQITARTCDAITADGARGSVQVADYFGTSHLFGALDNARKRMVHLISLYLENLYGDDLTQAAQSLQDNSLLSHSRGGNDLLKKLHAMPESAVFDGGMQAQSLKEFQDERTLVRPLTLSAYRKELLRRERNAASQAAARWYAQAMRVPLENLDAVAADVVIRTALLCRLGGVEGCPDRQEFAALLLALRSKAGVTSDRALASRKLKFPRVLLDQIPQGMQVICDEVRQEIERHDAPLLLDPDQPLDAILHQLEARYFLRETGMEDIDAFDAFVSEAWLQLTKGKEDPYSRQTLLLCLAADVKPKSTLSVTEARSLIRQVRQRGFNETVVPELIRSAAPFSIRDDLLSMWEEEFFPEAQLRLLDPADDKALFAMQFLSENCNIKEKSVARKSD